MIEEFKGEYSWLSNFQYVDIIFEGKLYPSVEHAYMSAKNNSEEWKSFCQDENNKPVDVRKKSRQIELVDNWENIKIKTMYTCLVQKFNKEPFKTFLLKTDNMYIQEGNWWGDVFWGVDIKTGKGENNLGKLIMKIRNDLKNK